MDFRYGRSFSGGGNGNGTGMGHRRYSRSRSRSRERNRRRQSRSRSRDRDRSSHYRRHHGPSPDHDLYRDLINEDYQEDQRHYGTRKTFDLNRQHRNDDGHDRRHDRDNYDSRNQNQNSNYDRRDRGRSDNKWEHDCFDPREMDDELDRNERWMNRDRESRQRSYDDYEEELERDSPNNSNGNNNEMSIKDRARERSRSRERRYSSDDDSYEGDEMREKHEQPHQNSTEPSNNIILFGLKKYVTEADIMGELIKVNMEPASIRVMRKQPSGASRCFAFVEFKTVEEARQWMDLTQGLLRLADHSVSMQYSHTRTTDWTCIKCGASNFKRRFQCFLCNSSREESDNAAVPCDGEGIDEISDLLTKKIMLRNLDALTNEEGVLTALQDRLSSDQAKTVSKVQISRDTLTQASRGICYLNFETLVESMNMYNGLTALDPPLSLDGRKVLVSYCKDPENRKIFSTPPSSSFKPSSGGITAMTASALNGNYTLADVPRLAAYSASVYASNPVEHAYYVQYYTDYYTREISKQQSVNPHLTEANSGAAVALSAIQRSQQKKNSSQGPLSMAALAVAGAKASFAAQGLKAPRGNDGKTYSTPDVSQYQYDETSGYYYDRTTGLYYDAHSQYYYNNETRAYLYWDQKRSTYVLATPASTQAALQEVLADAEQKEEEARKAKEKEKDKEGGGGHKQDKVKVAKKIVKDMEKWAKQLNQKKDYTAVATPQPILKETELPSTSRASQASQGYADLGFSLLEKRGERGAKTTADLVPQSKLPVLNKLAFGGISEDSEDESTAGPSLGVGATATATAAVPRRAPPPKEADYVDFQKLTCQLCKRAFQSMDILQKHIKISTLHKENLVKLNQNAVETNSEVVGLSYRDRAKERRLKYGEGDPPPPNLSREIFEQDMKTLQQTGQKNDAGQATPAMPIGSSNVGNRLMQKMGWSEGQGLGRTNQGRTQIIEAEGRTNNVGLGNKTGGQMFPGSDYKTYIKKMMKQRYDNA